MEVPPSGTPPGAQKCGCGEGAKPYRGFILARMGWKDYQSKEVIGKAERRLTPGQTGSIDASILFAMIGESMRDALLAVTRKKKIN